jgi:3D (Asp-Asp-Asp) domain-containing protein
MCTREKKSRFSAVERLVVMAIAVFVITLFLDFVRDHRDAQPEPTWKLWGEARVTAYCPCGHCCDRFSDGITASGKPVTYNNGRFAAGPPELVFGTLVDIPGYGKVEVIDRGGAIKGKRLDVFFPTHQEALQWGVQHLEVEVRQGTPVD